MSNKIFILILVWTLVFTLWAWALPPGSPPGGGGLISWDQPNGRLVISTTTVWSGTGTVININSKKLIGVPDPVNNLDAVNKRYVDQNYGGSNATRLWGEGRGTAVINGAGDCRTDTDGDGTNDTKVSRGNVAVTWEGAAAGCPSTWWVCALRERDDDPGSNYGACGSTDRAFVECDVGGSGGDELKSGSSNRAWVAERDGDRSGKHVTREGLAGGSEGCFRLPVWCCKSL